MRFWNEMLWLLLSEAMFGAKMKLMLTLKKSLALPQWTFFSPFFPCFKFCLGRNKENFCLELPQNDPTSLTKKKKFLKNPLIIWLLTGWSHHEQKTQGKRKATKCLTFSFQQIFAFFIWLPELRFRRTLLACLMMTTYLNPFGFSPSRWVRPSLPLNRECSEASSWRPLKSVVCWSTTQMLHAVTIHWGAGRACEAWHEVFLLLWKWRISHQYKPGETGKIGTFERSQGTEEECLEIASASVAEPGGILDPVFAWQGTPKNWMPWRVLEEKHLEGRWCVAWAAGRVLGTWALLHPCCEKAFKPPPPCSLHRYSSC